MGPGVHGADDGAESSETPEKVRGAGRPEGPAEASSGTGGASR